MPDPHQLLNLGYPRALNELIRCRSALLILALFLLPDSAAYCDSQPPRPIQFTYEIVKQFPHDPEAFTQGLVYDQGNVFEATGLHGRSSLRLVDLQTGKVTRRLLFDRQIFAEGITVLGDRIYQLTWKNNLILAFTKHDFSLVQTWSYPREGWGITNDNKYLVVSDGSAHLYFLHPETMAEHRLITVHDDQGPVSRLNELEYVNGTIYANIWKADRIAMIDPENGVVQGYLDLGGLSRRMQKEIKADVLNGIMHDEAGDRLFVTGKLWPVLYEIRAVPVDQGNRKPK